jgi:hypothetical protein
LIEVFFFSLLLYKQFLCVVSEPGEEAVDIWNVDWEVSGCGTLSWSISLFECDQCFTVDLCCIELYYHVTVVTLLYFFLLNLWWLCRALCSEAELHESLKALKAIQLNSYWRLLDDNYIRFLSEMVLSTVQSMMMRVNEIDIPVIVSNLEEFPEAIVRYILSLMSGTIYI